MGPDSDSRVPGETGNTGDNLKIIDLEFETLRQFREVMAPRLSYDGFFIATEHPLPRGTPARFRFLLPDGFVLAEGSGVIAWSRYEDEGPELKPGMALLFNELSNQSREIIDELIDFHIATGGDPFDIGPRATEIGDIGTDALAGDAFEVTQPEPPEPGPVEPAPEAAGADRVLPDWLSEVAQRHDVDLSPDATIPIATRPDLAEAHEEPSPEQQEFEISLAPPDDEAESTPFQVRADTIPEITMTPGEVRRPPRPSRSPWLRIVLPVVVVLVAASAIVYWLANRGHGPAIQESALGVEEIGASEPIDERAAGQSGEEGWGPTAASEPSEGQASETGEPATEAEQLPEEIEAISEPAGPATRLLLVTATATVEGTVVTVRANGELTEGTVRVSLLKGPARVWIRIQGIETFYRPNDIPVGSPEVERIRVGHHPEETPQSIYVVVDLADPTAVVRESTIEGETLRVVVSPP